MYQLYELTRFLNTSQIVLKNKIKSVNLINRVIMFQVVGGFTSPV